MIGLSEGAVSDLFDRYADMVYRIALNIVKSREEAQDIVMDTFLAMINRESFESDSHAKAWLIRTAHNKAVNVMRSGRIRRSVPLDEFLENTLCAPASGGEQELLDLVLRLPEYPIVESGDFIGGADGNGKLYAGRGEMFGKEIYLGGFRNADGRYVAVEARNIGCRAFAKVLAQLYTGSIDPPAVHSAEQTQYRFE